jgi:RNA polymerase sigma factor (sigma-70 family)
LTGGEWFTTRSGILRGEAGWELIAPYADPVSRFLSRRFPDLGQADRDDLLQDILVAMRTHLVEKFDSARGGFRPYLRTAIVNRVRDHYRRRKVRAGSQDAADAPSPGGSDPAELLEEDADALDLEACLVGSLYAFHDKRTRSGAADDLEVLYTFAGSLVDGLSNEDIAAKEGKSKDQVKRLLQRARNEILVEFLVRAAPGIEAKAPLEKTADLVRRIFREPRKRQRILEAEPNRTLASAVDQLLDRLEAARARLPVLASTAGKEFEEALRAVFSPGEELV